VIADDSWGRMNTVIIAQKQLEQLSRHLTGPGLDQQKGSFLVQTEASVSSHRRTCLIFHSSPSLNSHPLREVFSQHQKDPENKLVELGKTSNSFSLQYTQNRRVIFFFE